MRLYSRRIARCTPPLDSKGPGGYVEIIYIMQLIERIRKYFKRKPLSIASDFIFFALIIMLLIPGTRSILLSGVAGIRTMLTPAGKVDSGLVVDEAGWNSRMADQDGNVNSLADFRGRVLFINQWATWCPPCRAEMPSIEKLYKKMGSKVAFIMVSNEDPGVVKDFIRRRNYTFPVYSGAIGGQSLATRSIPSTAIISKDGEILIRRNGALNWNAQKIIRLLTRAADK